MRIEARASCIVLSLVSGLWAAPALQAQRAEGAGAEAQRARTTPAIRESVYDSLVKAQACIDADDTDCARQELARVERNRNLSGYESAQMWTVYGTLYISEESYSEAISAFERVLDQEGLTLAVEQSTLHTLAQLYGQEERYADALEALDRWFALSEAPSPQTYMLKARFHYSLGEYSEVIEPAETAIRIRIAQGGEPQEAWYQLLQYAYFELEDYHSVLRVGTALLERWPKKDHIVLLAGVYGQLGNEGVQLALYEAAYEAGWLVHGSELVTLAQMLLQAEIPYKAARMLEAGIEGGVVESSEANWRLLAQAWQLAREDERAIPALMQASELSPDGTIDLLLAHSYANLHRWEACTQAAGQALERGGLDRQGDAEITLGSCLLLLRRYDSAKAAFRRASRDPARRDSAEKWLLYAESEEASARERAEMLEHSR